MRALFIDCELFIFESALEPIFSEAAQHLCPQVELPSGVRASVRAPGRALGNGFHCGCHTVKAPEKLWGVKMRKE